MFGWNHVRLFRNAQLTVVLTVLIDGARINVGNHGGSYCTVTVNNRQLSILEKLGAIFIFFQFSDCFKQIKL